MGNYYATPENDDTDYRGNTHIKGTISRGGGNLEFWLSRPRPAGFSIDEWEEQEQAKWERIFPKEAINAC